MAIHHINDRAGSDTTGNGSEANPWRTLAAVNILPGDEVRLAWGGVYNQNESFKDFRSGAILRPYGPAGARPILRNPTGAGNMILACSSASSRSGNLVENIDFDCTTDTATKVTRAIYFAAQGAGTISSVTIRGSRFRGGAASGCALNIEDAASGTLSGFVFDGNEFDNNAGHGLLLMGVGHVVRRNRAWENGATNADGGHNISARYARTDVSSGFTLVSGTRYTFTVPANKTTIDYIQIIAGAVAGTMRKLVKNIATPTTPAAGEFGVDGTTVYFDLGVAATGHTLNYAWGKCSGLLIENNECWLARYSPATPFYEGVGIALDDYTSNSTVRRNSIRDCEGRGISLNRGDGNKVYSNEVVRCGLSGIFANDGAGTVIEGNTFAGNDTAPFGSPDLRDITVFGKATGAVVRSNLSIARTSVSASARGISSAGSAAVQASITVEDNHLYGYSQAVETGVPNSGTVTTDPQVTSDYRPLSGSPLLTAGPNTYRRDKEGRQARRFIGAFGAATLLAISGAAAAGTGGNVTFDGMPVTFNDQSVAFE